MAIKKYLMHLSGIVFSLRNELLFQKSVFVYNATGIGSVDTPIPTVQDKAHVSQRFLLPHLIHEYVIDFFYLGLCWACIIVDFCRTSVVFVLTFDYRADPVTKDLCGRGPLQDEVMA